MNNSCDIVILTRNHYQYTKLCLESLFGCDSGYSVSVNVFDNASTDGTPDNLVRDFGDKVTVWRSDQNLGFAAANNMVLDRTKGRFACLLNNDTVVTPNWLGEMIEVMESDSRIGIVGCRGNNVSAGAVSDQAVDWKCDVDIDNANIAAVNSLAAKMSRLRPRLKIVGRVVGFCMLMRRSMINTIGLLDERFWPGNFEDNDICNRAVEAGYKIAVANRSFVHHFISTTFRDDEKEWHRLFAINKARYKAKWVDNGRIEHVGEQSKERLRAAFEIPTDTADRHKVVQICEELRMRGGLVHTFSGSQGDRQIDCGIPHVTSVTPSRRYGGCPVIVHSSRLPGDDNAARDFRTHVRLHADSKSNSAKRVPKKHFAIVLGDKDDGKLRPHLMLVRWRGEDKHRRKIGEEIKMNDSFHDMVDIIESYLIGIQAADWS